MGYIVNNMPEIDFFTCSRNLSLGVTEKAGTKVRPVQYMVNHPTNINSPRSAHGGILSHHSWKKKVPGTCEEIEYGPVITRVKY